MELDRIGEDSPAIGSDLFTDLDGGGQGGPQEFERLFNYQLRPQGFPLLRSLTAEGQDLLDQVLGRKAALVIWRRSEARWVSGAILVRASSP